MTQANSTPGALPAIEGAIRNPENPMHFMAATPAGARLRASWDGTLLCETDAALRVVEVGHFVYPPRFCVPPDRRAVTDPPQLQIKGNHSWHLSL